MPPDHLSVRRRVHGERDKLLRPQRRLGRYGDHWFILRQALDAYADQLASRIEAE
jgi:hypothetical protein